MRTFLLLSSCFIILSSFSNQALARGYFGFKGGLGETQESEIIDKRIDNSTFSGAIGSYIGPFRLEGEYTYAGNAKFKEEKTQAQFHRGMIQGYIDFPVTRYVLPYINAGAGVSYYDVDYLKTNQTGSNFTWNAGAGLGVRLTKNVTADMGLRYVDMGSVEIKDSDTELKFNSYETYVGLRFLF